MYIKGLFETFRILGKLGIKPKDVIGLGGDVVKMGKSLFNTRVNPKLLQFIEKNQKIPTKTIEQIKVHARTLKNASENQKKLFEVNIRGLKYDYVGTAAAGSVMATLEDMCTYSKALLNKSNGIISQDVFDSMLEVQYSPDPDLSIKMGLGFQVKSIFGHYAYGHNGGISGGWNTVMLLFPKLDFGLMIHLNLSSGLVEEITDEIVYALLGKPAIDIVKTPINDDQKNKILGVYRQRPGFVARSRPIRSLGRIQIIEKENNLYIQSRRGEWREATKIFKSDYGSNIYVVDDGKINPTLISISGDTLTVDRLASLDKDNRAKTW